MPRRVAVVPHTHWDREWYLPFETYRARLVEMLDELIPELGAADPEAGTVFLLDGQMAVIDDYLELRPSMESELRKLVEAERLSVGPWYVLPDEFLVSGETLIRNLEMGLDRAADFGGAMELGYLPDMFGHISQMPQILRGFGFSQAVVWRGVPKAVDRTGFWWRAPDGSEVRAEYLPQGYGNGAHLPADPALAVDLIANFESANAPMLLGDILWMHGSDHQPPTPDLAARIDALNAAQDSYDLVATSLPDYLAAAPTTGLPTWSGELRSGARTNLLMGVASNRVDIRRAAGEIEFLLEKVVEPVAALLGDPDRWPARQLDRAWRQLVLNSAHDSICGCSLDEVCDAVLGRYATAHQVATALLERSLDQLADQLDTISPTVVNPSRSARSGLVEIEVRAGETAPEPHQVLETDPGSRTIEGLRCAALPEMVSRELEIFGNTHAVTIDKAADAVEVVVHADSEDVFAPGAVLGRLRALAGADPDRPARLTTLTPTTKVVLAATPRVPGYGWAVLGSTAGSNGEVKVTGQELDNGVVRVRIEEADGTFALNGSPGLGRLIDSGDVGDTYNYCPPDADEILDSPAVADIRVIEAGPLRGRVEVDRRLADLLIRTRLEVRAGEAFVRCRVQFENTQRDHRLRVLHTLPEPASGSVAGCAFATVSRGLTAEGGPTEAPLATYPARDFVTAGGLTVATVGSFEYELVELDESPLAGAVAVTLVRSTGWLSRGPMTTRPLPAGPEIPLEGSQVRQNVVSDQVLAFDCDDPFALHEAAFSPLLVVRGSGEGPLMGTGAALATAGGVVSAVRKVGDELEVRAFNPSTEPVEFAFGGLRAELGPWQIRTLRLAQPELGK